MTPSRQRIAGVAGIVVVALTLVCIRVAWSGAQEHRDGLAALGARDDAAAIDHLSRSARWYLPGSSRVRQALEELLRVGQRAEAHSDVDTALAAYREVRRDIRAVRSLWVPNADLQPQADARIAHLMAGQSERNRAGEVVPFAARRDEHLALLKGDDAPDPWWSLLVVLAFAGWVGGAYTFIFRAWDEEGRFHGGPALLWAGVVVACLALWVIAMGQA